MKALLASALFTGVLCTGFAGIPTSSPEAPTSPQDPPGPQDLAAMMEQARRYTEPGENHELLERFLGTWNTETRFFLGDQSPPPEKGTAETTWLMEGRWLQTKTSGQIMGRPSEAFSLMGYDNFKMSYVFAGVSSMDTAIGYYEGDLDPIANVLIMYGTLDEYLTGEHDKMVKTVTRFLSEDKIVMEIHDLAIGEANTKVLEITSTR